MIYKLLLFITLCVHCYSACSNHIPEATRREYGIDFQNAFRFQSEGESTHATYYFEQGCMKAMKAGESIQKVEAIRQLFIWYRTYGYFLGLMTKNPQIIGQYTGAGRYASYSGPPLVSLNYGTSPERDAMVREYLFGVTEVLSGMLCLWIGPPPFKAAGLSLVVDGGKRMWNAGNKAWTQQDISMFELTKKIEGLKNAAM